MKYQVLDEQLLNNIRNAKPTDQSLWLFLDRSEEFRGRWTVDALIPQWYFDFEGIVDAYRTLSPTRLKDFLSTAAELHYKVVFVDDPEQILEEYEHLSDEPPFEISSSLPETVKGFLPWQVTGFNKLTKSDTSSGLVVWSTGTGKTVFIASTLLWHDRIEGPGRPYDLAVVVVKSNNKADMNRKLKRLGEIDSCVVDGSKEKREKLYANIEYSLRDNEQVVVVTNYEKLREDADLWKKLVNKRNVLFFWDEMPKLLSNRKTKVYKAIKGILWKRFMSKEEGLEGAIPRAKWMRQFALTATPVENTPEGAFNYVRLMNPPLLGKVEEFQNNYVATRNYFSGEPERWHHLDKLEAKLEHITHRVSREDDPEVAKMFPAVLEDTLVIDWAAKDRKIYDILTGKAKEIIEADFEDANILALIQVLQMVCDAPSMIAESAKNREAYEALLSETNWEDGAFPSFNFPKGSEIARTLLEALKTPPSDEGHTKLETWREILQEKHPNEKALTFMTWSSYGMKPLTNQLDKWGITYVTYEGTQKQANEAKDRFREDPGIQVFLSSDRGADSIDLPEAAVGINYNLPWTWVRKKQRLRNVRVDSSLGTNYWYDLVMANSVEERKQEIIDQKYAYHAALFDGRAIDDSISARITKDELLHILLG